MSHKRFPGIMDLFHLVYFPVIDYFVTDDVSLLEVSNDIVGLNLFPSNTQAISLSDLLNFKQ